MKLLVAGGRDKWLSKDGFYCLDALFDHYKVDMLIQGGAKGIDTAAKQWGEYRKIPVVTVKAEWDLHGKRAGYLRNLKMADMLTDSDVGVLFWGGKGTSMMKEILENRHISIYNFMLMGKFVRNIKRHDLLLPCNLCYNPLCTGLTCIGYDDENS